MNNVSLIGRMVSDADLRYTQSGIAVANFRLAVNRSFTNKNGEREADFINCVTWRKSAENLAQYMKKGSRVGVVGEIQTRTYQDDQDRTVYVTEVNANNVIFLENISNQGNQQNQGQQQRNQQGNQNYQQQQNQGQQQQGNQNYQQQGNQQNYQQQQQGNQQNYQQQNQGGGQATPFDIQDDDLPF